MQRILLASALALYLDGCAQIEVSRVLDHSAETEGVRYYRPSPYLLVSPTVDDHGVVLPTTTAKIIWLPNLNEEYEIQASSGLGSVNFTPTLADGWNLTSLAGTVDSKFSENVAAIAGLLTSASGAAKPFSGTMSNGQEPAKQLEVGVYPLLFGTHGYFCGLGPNIASTKKPIADQFVCPADKPQPPGNSTPPAS